MASPLVSRLCGKGRGAFSGATSGRPLGLLTALLGAQVLLIAFGLGTGCGPDDLPPGVLPGTIISYEPTRVSTGTSGGTTGASLSITNITPTSPTAGTTVTITGRGFGTDAKLLAFQYPAAAVSASRIDSARPELTPVVYASSVTTATDTSLIVRLPADIISGSVLIGVRASAASTSGPSQFVTLVRVSNSVTLNITPRILSLQGLTAPGSTFSLEVTGASPKLSSNTVRFLSASAVEIGSALASEVVFNPGLTSGLSASVPSTLTTPVARLIFDVSGRKSAPFP
ncbi:MAG: IPT/TIG domain-containing protein [Candidatus Riflebacteria bacterium]|nr:IPT/TIG domain-containing protein [Candidatus Riflebacteria bacterium]